MQRLEMACAVLILFGFAGGNQPQKIGATEKQQDASPKQFIPAERFKHLPKGWSVVDSIVLSEDQIAGFSKRFGGEIVRTTNTRLSLNGQQIKVNVIECRTKADAKQVHKFLLPLKNNIQDACLLQGTWVIEFVYGANSIHQRALYDFGFKPRKVTYEIRFDAAPIKSCDYMAWNKMFNACLKADAGLISQLASTFQFGQRLEFRHKGLGDQQSTFEVTPSARRTTKNCLVIRQRLWVI